MAINLKDFKRIDEFKVPPEKLVIRTGWNVRDDSDPDVAQHIREIANNIHTSGIQYIPALTVYTDGDEVVVTDGYCRTKAALLAISEGAEVPWLPCRPEERYSDEADRVMSMLHRNGGLPLKPLQKAMVIKRLLSLGLNESEVAKRAGISLSAVKDAVVLLSTDQPVKDMVTAGEVSATQVVKTVRKEGKTRATAVLTDAVEKAKGQGKTRATAKHVEPVMPMQMEYLAQKGYEGYCGHTGGVSLVSGAELPGWSDLSINIQEAWIAAARAIVEAA